MPNLPEFAPAAGFIAFWILVGICPDWWPFPKGPGPWPPPPPWLRAVAALAAVVGGATFTSLAGGGAVQSTAPILEFAATGAFALVSAVAARVVVGQFAAAPQGAAALEGGAAFRR